MKKLKDFLDDILEQKQVLEPITNKEDEYKWVDDLDEKIQYSIIINKSDLEKAKEALDTDEIMYEVGEEDGDKIAIDAVNKRSFKQILQVIDSNGFKWEYPEEMEDTSE